MDYGLQLITPPTAQSVTLPEARRHLRLPASSRSQDPLIESLIAAAVEHVETETNRQQMPATWKLVLDVFPAVIYLPRAPLVSVDKIDYIDEDGVSQEFPAASYLVQTEFEPGRVVLSAGENWPDTAAQLGSISIQYQCGYADAGSVPPALKQAVLLMVGHWFENREAVTDVRALEVPRTAQRLIDNMKVGDEVLQYAAGRLG